MLLPSLGEATKAPVVKLEPRSAIPQKHVEQMAKNLDVLKTEAEQLLRRNNPLHDGQPPLESEASLQMREKSALPPGKEKSPEAEQRRMAAMAGNIGYEHEKFEKKGMLAFACPLCHRPLWVSKKEEGSTVNCGGCGSDIISPTPRLGLPVRVVDPTDRQTVEQPARKAVIPEAREKSGNVPVRGESLLPKPELPPTAAPVVLPSERISQARTIGARRTTSAPPDAPVPVPVAPPVQAEPQAEEVNRPKGAVRLNEKRRDFKPVKEIETDVEVTEAWGAPQDKVPLSRRYLILAWVAAVPIFLGLAVWGMREVFRKKDPKIEVANKGKEDEDQVMNLRLAEEVLRKFHLAETVEAKAEFVRHPEITLPRMKEFYGDNLVKYHFQSFTDAREGRRGQFDFITGTMTLKNEKPRLVSLEILPQSSKVLIDWESLVYWSEVPWEKFLGQQMERPHEFRVTMVRDDYYNNGVYEDETRWICWKLYHPASVGEEYGYCYGYTDVSSDVTTEMIQPMRVAAERGQKNLRAILSLRFHPDARGKPGAPQVHIEKFTPGWLVP